MATTRHKNDPALFVQTNRAALDAARRGLLLRAEAPAEAYVATSLLLGRDLPRLKQLGHAFRHEGLHYETQGNYAAAAQSHLDTVRLGQKVEAGPVICMLVGMAIESIGLTALEKIEPHLKEGDRTKLASDLEKLRAERFPFGEVLRRERYFMRQNARNPAQYLVAIFKSRGPQAGYRQKYDRPAQASADLIAKLRKEN